MLAVPLCKMKNIIFLCIILIKASAIDQHLKPGNIGNYANTDQNRRLIQQYMNNINNMKNNPIFGAQKLQY
eukprot:UN03134